MQELVAASLRVMGFRSINPVQIEQKRVPRPLGTDGRGRAMPGMDHRFVWKFEQSTQRRLHVLWIRGGKINPADRAGEQRVAGDQSPA